MGVKRTTVWQDARGNTVRVAVCHLNAWWEPISEVTQDVGPFDDWREVAERANTLALDQGGWRCYQGALFD